MKNFRKVSICGFRNAYMILLCLILMMGSGFSFNIIEAKANFTNEENRTKTKLALPHMNVPHGEIYNQLNAKQKKIYDIIYTIGSPDCWTLSTSNTIKYYKCDEAFTDSTLNDDFGYAEMAVAQDHPSELQFENSCGGLGGYFSYNGEEHLLGFEVTPELVSQRQELKTKCQQIITSLGTQINTSTADLTAITAYNLMYYIYENVTYDYNLEYTQHYAKATSAYYALVKEHAICGGISNGYRALLETAGIPQYYITGTSRGEHAWTMVKVGGKWYECDAGGANFAINLEPTYSQWYSIDTEKWSYYKAPVSNGTVYTPEHIRELMAANGYSIPAESIEVTPKTAPSSNKDNDNNAWSDVPAGSTIICDVSVTPAYYTVPLQLEVDDYWNNCDVTLSDDEKTLTIYVHEDANNYYMTHIKLNGGTGYIGILAAPQNSSSSEGAGTNNNTDTNSNNNSNNNTDANTNSNTNTDANTNADTSTGSNNSQAAESTDQSAKTNAETENKTIENADVIDKSVPTPRKVKVSTNKTSATVKWKKQTKNTKGYEIQYSTDKNFETNVKTISVKKAATSKTIKKLKTGKKYYIRIRTKYKKGPDTVYSEWSKVKKVKIK